MKLGSNSKNQIEICLLVISKIKKIKKLLGNPHNRQGLWVKNLY